MAKAQAIGRLRFRLQLLIQADTAAGQNTSSKVKTYTEVATRDGDSKLLRGAHHFKTKNTEETLTHEFIIRYEDQFKNRSKITHIHDRGDVYEIMQAGVVDSRKRYLSLKCVLRGDASVFNIIALP